MSVNPAVCLNVEKGDGVAKTFVYTFRSFKDNNNKYTIKVSVLEKDGTLTDKVEGTDYTVTRTRQGGNITFNVAPPLDSNVIMESNVEFTQTFNFTSGQQVDGYILTNALDEIAMKILQLKCKSDSSVKINRDPLTGKSYAVSFDKPTADKVLSYDSTGTKVIASSYSIDDLKALATSIDNALIAANAANTAAQAGLAAANTAKTEAQSAATTATQAKTDAQASQQAADASKTAAQTSETNINNLYNTAIKPVSDLLQPPVADDAVLVGASGAWSKTAGLDFLKKLFTQIAGNGQLVWNDGGVVKGIDKTAIGGGGGGTDLSAVFNGQPAGAAMVADPGATDKYSFQQVPAIKTPDPTKAGQAVVYNPTGTGFTSATVPTLDNLIVLNKADPTDTVDGGVTIPAGQAVEVFKNLQLHFDVANDKWEIILGDNSMGGSTIPTPPTTPLSYLATEKLTNGVGMKWDPLKLDRPTSSADDGKIWAWNQAADKFELVAPMADTPLTRSLTGETGVSGAPEIAKTAALTISIEPCILQFADPATYATTSHDLAQTTYALTGVTNTIVWVYADPKDSWAIKQQTTTPTLDERLGRVYLAEIEVTNSIIRSVKPIYNELSHKEYVLREIGDAIGTTARGAKFDVVANGLKAVTDATLFSFLARRVPLTGGGVFNSSKLFFTKDAVYNAYYVKNGVVSDTPATTFLPKIYMDATGNEATLVTGATAVTIHYVYAPATFDTATGNITGLYLIIGNSVYDSIASAKEDIMTADSTVVVPAFIARNCALIAKIFVRYDADAATDTTFAIINYANLSSKSTSVIHSSTLPDTAGVADGSVLQARNGNFVFDPNVKPLVAENPITDGQILTVQGGKAVGSDINNFPLFKTLAEKEKFYYITVTKVDIFNKIFDKTSNWDPNSVFGVLSVDNKTDPTLVTITLETPVLGFSVSKIVVFASNTPTLKYGMGLPRENKVVSISPAENAVFSFKTSNLLFWGEADPTYTFVIYYV